MMAILLFMAAPRLSVGPQTPREDTLHEAKRLAWLNNWTEAAQVLDQFERSGHKPDDEATALFARAVHIRGNIESMSLPKAADEVTAMLASGPAQNDFDLRIQLLAIKGDIEFQYSLPAAQKTWDEAAQLASSRGSGPWKARAEGELGTIAFLNGEIFTATKLVTGAALKAELSGDIASQIRYLTALGEGFAEYGRGADASRFFDKALALSAATPGAYFPFTAYLGKARLLTTTGRLEEGLRMLHEGLDEARRKGLKVREARILTVLGELAAAHGKQDDAVTGLSAAAEVARGAGLDRIDKSQIEAARDLGASPFRAFLHVTLPLSKASIMAGSALVILPMFGDYYTNDLISASPHTNMLGNEINLFVQGGSQKNLGAALVLVLMAILAVGMAYYLYATLRDQRRLA